MQSLHGMIRIDLLDEWSEDEFDEFEGRFKPKLAKDVEDGLM